MRFVSNLTASDIITLEEGFRNSKVEKFRDRCQCLLLSNKGHKVKRLANIFSVRTRTIYTWFNRYLASGIIGLFFKIIIIRNLFY